MGWGWDGAGRGLTTKGHEEIYGSDELLYILIVVTVTQLYFKIIEVNAY